MTRSSTRRRGHARAQRGLLLLLCVVIATLTGCAAGDQPADSPERSAEGKQKWYASPAHIAKSSDLVIQGKVTAISPGRTYGDDKEALITTRYVDIDVLDVLHGPADLSTVRLEEEGYDADGVGYVMNGVQWSKVGDEGYFLLRKHPDSKDTYLQVSSYGRILYVGDKTGPSGHEPLDEGRPWAGHGQDLKNKDGIEAALRKAVKTAATLPETATASAESK